MPAFNQILTIAQNTFREAVRDRVLYNLVVFMLLLTACAVLLGDLTAGQEARTIVNIGLTAMLIFGVFIAIFVGVSLVSKEIEKKTLYAVFSKPVGRGTFIFGKFAGLCLTLLVNVAVMGFGVSLALIYVGGGGMAASIWGAIVLIFLELMIITSVAVLFSSFSSPALSSLLTFLVFVIGHFSASLKVFAEGLGSSGAKMLFSVIYYVLPNFSNFSFVTAASHGRTPGLTAVLLSMLYAAVYSLVLLFASILIFRRRNLK